VSEGLVEGRKGRRKRRRKANSKGGEREKIFSLCM
jgi:hypothetical protein